MPQTPRGFISYARKDGEDFAIDLVQCIEQAEIPVCRDGLRGGEGGVESDLMLACPRSIFAPVFCRCLGPCQGENTLFARWVHRPAI